MPFIIHTSCPCLILVLYDVILSRPVPRLRSHEKSSLFTALYIAAIKVTSPGVKCHKRQFAITRPVILLPCTEVNPQIRFEQCSEMSEICECSLCFERDHPPAHGEMTILCVWVTNILASNPCSIIPSGDFFSSNCVQGLQTPLRSIN